MNFDLPHFVEMFEIQVDCIPKLFAYQLKLIKPGSGEVKIGRKLSDRLRRKLGGHWIWSEDKLITDIEVSDEKLKKAIQEVKSRESNDFKILQGLIFIIDSWKPTAKMQADFVAQGLFADFNREITQILQPAIPLGDKARVERHYEVRGWVVKEQPTVSITIESRVVFNQDLLTYASTLSQPDEMVGLWVVDKNPYENGQLYKGEIDAILGRLDIEIDRNDLLHEAQRETSRQLIQNAPQGEWVVTISGGYNYVISALNIIVMSKHYQRFGIDTQKAQELTWIKPGERCKLVEKVAQVGRDKKLIDKQWNSVDHKAFNPASSIHYDSRIVVGNGKTVEYKGGGDLIQQLTNFGLYSRSSNLSSANQPLKIGILNASSLTLNDAQNALRKQLQAFKFEAIEFEEIRSKNISRVEFERAINQILSREPHLVLGIIPDSDSTDDEDWGPYFEFKSLMMRYNVPSQVIDQNTLKKTKSLPYIMQNVALGIVTKLGNVPYVLANSLDYADFVMGIDIARQKSKRGKGSLNAAAVAQIYHKLGQFQKCHVIETPLEGETVPAKVLRSLFPLNEFQGKRVIIHRDGFFRGNEIEIIQEHFKQINATVYFVEVIKSGAPRFYVEQRDKQVTNPEIGTIFNLSSNQAFMITSETKTATSQPLQIRTLSSLTIGKALLSVLNLTLMHYGSVRRPRLPVSLHYSDKIGYLALRGLKPANSQSDSMYWL
jgi:hypothetical protein